MQLFKAIIFDLDGVIIDSEPLHEESERHTFQRHGLNVPDYVYDVFKGKTDRDLVEHVIQDYGDGGLDVEMLIHEKQQAFRDLIGRLELIPGVGSFIEKAADRFRLALTTSSGARNQQTVFDKFDLHRFFEVVVTSADVTRPKPDPEPYTITTERLGLLPSDCLVIEDSVNGVISAVAAGCTVAGLTTSFDEAALRRAGAHIIIANYEGLSDELGIPL